MLLRNLTLVIAGNSLSADIGIRNSMICSVSETGNSSSSPKNNACIDFEDALVFPGLINSHDHLDFNLFPAIGNRIYPNYREWGNEIHQLNTSTIQQVLKVPQSLRTRWGICRNLLNGFTSVANHGLPLPADGAMVNVLQHYRSLHSPGFEKNWPFTINNPFIRTRAFVIHAGEGTDAIAKEEIDELIKRNYCKRPLIAVHGVAMDAKQAASFKALVWCPVTNYFLLGQTADIASLQNATTILFGSDSTLTAGWNIWDHLRTARNTRFLSDEALLMAVTEKAADVWGLKNSAVIQEGYTADLVIAKRKNNGNSMDAFYSLNPEDMLLIIKGGEITLFAAELQTQLQNASLLNKSYYPVSVNGFVKYVGTDISLLMQQIGSYYPEADFSSIQSIQP